LICDVSSAYRIGDKHGEPDDETVVIVVVEVLVWPIPRYNRYWFWWAGDEASNLDTVFGYIRGCCFMVCDIFDDCLFGLEKRKSEVLFVLVFSWLSNSSIPNDNGSFSGIHDGKICR
jgi:hypothetical protein